MYRDAVLDGTGSASAARRMPKTELAMIALPRAILTEVVVGHVEEAKPNGEEETEHPRHGHAPKDPVGHAQDEADRVHVTLVAQEIADADAPGQGDGPHRHD